MDTPPSSRLWLIACGAAALCVLSLAGLIALQKRRALTIATSSRANDAGPDANAGPFCPVPETGSFRTQPRADAAPVLLWAAGSMRLFLDGAPAFSYVDVPARLAPGEHTLAIEVPRGEGLTTRFRIDPFTPALFHAQLDPVVGLTLVRLGAVCTGCSASLGPLLLNPASPSGNGAAPMAEAARSLRSDVWTVAAERLRSVPTSARSTPLFHRLAAAVFAAAAEPARARTELTAIPRAQSEGLIELLEQLDALGVRETARERTVVLTRWNELTEAFGRVVRRFEPELPGPTHLATMRLAELSKSFGEANQAGDLQGQRSLLDSGERALVGLVQQIRASRPRDCMFQARVVSALAQ